MTDKQTLFTYRLTQSQETLTDARKMLQERLSPRSIVNRAYYSMFYAVLALFIKEDISLKTSKHTGVIAIFDKEFVHTGKVDKYYSKALHKMFDARQEGDYKELVELSSDEADRFVQLAEEFGEEIKKIVQPENE